VLIRWRESARPGAGRYARWQAGGRQRKAAADQRKKERQSSADMVIDDLAAGPTTSLAFEQALCLSSARKTGLEMKKEAENPIYE
jgi:hypothetical protein